MIIETRSRELIINPIRIYFKEDKNISEIYYNVYAETYNNSYLIAIYEDIYEARLLIKKIKKFFSISSNCVFTQDMVFPI